MAKAAGTHPDPPKQSPPAPPERRVRTPTVLQMEAVECGAAALGIILGYFRKIVPLEQLRVDCGVSRDGSKASNVMKAARAHGLEAKGFRQELETLYQQNFPVILFWNFNHFLVLEGFRGALVYLNDPATGPRTCSLEELDACFSGVVLTFAPGEAFEPGGEKPSLFGALKSRLSGFELSLTFVLLCGLFLLIPGLVIPAFSRIFVDEFLVREAEDILRPLLIGMAFTAVLLMGLTWLQRHMLLRLETKLALMTASRFFTHIMRLPVSYFAQRFAGEIGSRVQINDRVAQFISGQLIVTVLEMVLVVFYAILMLQYDVGLTLLCVVLALMNLGAVRYVSRKRIDGSRRLLQEQGKMTGTAMGGLQMIETLKATGTENEFFARWAGYQAKALRAQQQLSHLALWVGAVPALTQTLTTAAILFFGGLRVMDGAMTIGMLVAFQSLARGFSQPLETFVNFGGKVQELEGDMNRLDDVLRYPQDERYRRDPAPRPPELANAVKLEGRVTLRHITFGYSPLEKPLIEDFSLEIAPGQKVALVGGSGSGKSTVARLVSGLYRPWQGQILLDGIPLEELPADLLANSLGMVDQDIFLFGGTVRENLTMWDATIPEGQIMQASRDAVIDGFVSQRPSGFDARVEEGGSNFSGGQRQRMEIARALVGHPSVLILDEATSALDPAAEARITDALSRRGCTCLIVAHRLSTIRDCDEIVVLERGKIVQRGKHEEMIRKEESPYARLLRED